MTSNDYAVTLGIGSEKYNGTSCKFVKIFTKNRKSYEF